MFEINTAEIFRDIVKLCVRKLGLLQKGGMTGCGITVAQCHTLVEIGKYDRMTLNELSDIITLDKSTMSRTVNNLVKAGLADRETDKEDRRYTQINLTEKGREMVDVINGNMTAYYERVLASIPAEKQAQARELLPYLLDAVQKTELNAGYLHQVCSEIIEE